MKAHLISQILLRRFVINSKVRVHRLDNHSSYLNNPKATAYVDVVGEPFKSIESKYGYTETRMATAFDFLDNGSLLKHPKHVESVKKFMALHYVRAAIFYLLMKQEPEHFNKFLKDTKFSHPNKEKEIEEKKGVLRHELRKKMIAALPALIKSLMRKVETHIDKYDLEVGIAPEDVSFLIGDITVLTRTDDGNVGVLSGAAVTNSIAFGMPLGPKHLVALSVNNKSTRYRHLTVKEVSNCNEKLLKQCVSEYYTLP
ncbi:MAG TPA: DUF4238 domain-containing protein [Candidatus Saccharimonadales bacterium]|nr:DUF4238 domain-containing protein [Candidatus Saccharimonadales bacterium]